MLFEDVVVGEKYRMIENEEDCIKKGAIVKIVDTDSYSLLNVQVEDLSEDKCDDGIWWTKAGKLEPIKEESDCAPSLNAHYATAHQPIEVMQANMTHDELVGFLKGNIIKYACRCGRKDDPKKEAAKIEQYAEWLSVVLNGGTIDPRA